MDFRKLREDFPTLRAENAPTYLDNACVTLKPDSVINSIHDYYTKTPSCGGRSVHRYGIKVSQSTAHSRSKLQGIRRLLPWCRGAVMPCCCCHPNAAPARS